MNKTAIIFGANGYLGRHIAYFMKQNNMAFIPTGSASSSIDNYSNYQQIDITNLKELQRLNFNGDYVFAFAGLTGTGDSDEIVEKFTKVNEIGLANIIACCQTAQVERLIFPSTRLVYKGIENTALKEDAAKEAKTIYAKNKLACEKMLKSAKVPHTIFRICVPYGNLLDTNYSYGTIGFFIGKALKGEDITIYGNGSLKRTFTHVSDIVQLIFESLQLENTTNKTYNIGSNDNLSLLEVAQLVAQKYKVNVAFTDWPKAALAIESGDTIFDGGKLQKLTQYCYKNSLSNWIKEIG